MNLGKLKFNVLYFLASIILMTTFPVMMSTVLYYMVTWITAEMLQEGRQRSKMPLVRGLILFIGYSIGFFFLMLMITNAGILKITPVDLGRPLLASVLFAFIVAGFEEDIFRNILMKLFRNEWVCSGIFAGIHYYTGRYIHNFTGSAIFNYIGFMFVFSLIMFRLIKIGKNVEIARAAHFVYLLFWYGVGG